MSLWFVQYSESRIESQGNGSKMAFTRLLLAIGLGFSAWSFYIMTGWTPDVSAREIIVAGLVQGAGFGILFVPMSAVTLSTLAPEYRADGDHAAAVEG
jgi:hypothetical protein